MTPSPASPGEILPWDSDFFGFTIARVRPDTLTPALVARLEAWCREEGVRCLYFLARPDDRQTIKLAEAHGFQLVDIRTTLEHTLSHLPPNPPDQGVVGLEVRPPRPGDLPALKEIAAQSYHQSRFYFDDHFPAVLSDLLYTTWIEKSVEGFAERVFVAEFAGEPCGYLTCHLEADSLRGKIGLAGIGLQARGRGIGKTLVLTALDWFKDQGVKQVRVVTQGRNIPAQGLYQSCGFRTQGIQLWYHKWYPQENL